MNFRLHRIILSALSIGYAVNTPAEDMHQYCNPAITSSAPDSRYRLQGDGHEVLDLRTRLVWQRCEVGQTWDGAHCQGRSAFMTLPEAQAAAAALGQGWRVPDIRELKTLVDFACVGPARNLRIFPLDSGGNLDYWSVTPVSYERHTVWGIDISFGNITPETTTSSVPRTRLVRGPVRP